MTAGNDIENGLASSLTERLFLFTQPGEQRASRGICQRGKSAIEVWS